MLDKIYSSNFLLHITSFTRLTSRSHTLIDSIKSRHPEVKTHFDMGVLLKICCIFSENLLLRTPLSDCYCNIISNVNEECTSRNIINTIWDHLDQCLVTPNCSYSYNSKNEIFQRNFKNFKEKNFLSDLKNRLKHTVLWLQTRCRSIIQNVSR